MNALRRTSCGYIKRIYGNSTRLRKPHRYVHNACPLMHPHETFGCEGLCRADGCALLSTVAQVAVHDSWFVTGQPHAAALHGFSVQTVGMGDFAVESSMPKESPSPSYQSSQDAPCQQTSTLQIRPNHQCSRTESI